MALLPITAPVKVNETSANVANLQAALTALGLTMSPDEVKRQTAGQQTLAVIRLFQSQQNIAADGNVLVDDATAAALNKLLHDRQLLTDNKTYTITGRVLNDQQEPLGRKTLAAFDVDLRGARVYKTSKTIDEITKQGGFQPLGNAVSAPDGSYSISFDDAQYNTAELGLADVVVYATVNNAIVGRSLLSTDGDYNDLSLAGWDVIITATADRGISEFIRLQTKINGLLQISGVLLTDLFTSDDQVAFMATETKSNISRVRLFVAAARLAQSLSNTPRGHEFLYGLGRKKITLSFSAIGLTDEKVILSELQAAIADNIIDPAADTELQAFVYTLLSVAISQSVSAPPTDAVKSLVQSLQITTTDSGIQSAFINAARSYSGEARDFWEKYLPAQPQFVSQPQMIRSFQLTNQLTALTSNHVPLIQELQGTRKIQTPADLLNLSDADWTTIVTKTGVPEGTPGAGAAEQAAAYIGNMQGMLNAAFPTQRIGIMAASGQLSFENATVGRLLPAFFSAAPAFDIATSRLSDFDAQLASAGGQDKQALKDGLAQVQRLYAISPRPESLGALVKAGFHSAYQVANIPQQAFIDSHSGILGGTDIALAVHQRASFQVMRMQSIVASVNSIGMQYAPQAVLSPGASKAAQDVVTKSIPNWTELFGSPDSCECSECRSVYGAAAYLVDILQFLGALGRNFNNEAPLDKLLQRRPDIANLPLTCENTNTVIPYIDLVNEIMEYYVVHGMLDASAAYDTGDASPDELRANPQHTLKEAYRKLAGAVYPFGLPYHQPLDMENIYYKQLRTTRAEVMTTLQTDFSPAANTAIQAERLALSQEAYTVLTGKDFTGAAVALNTRDAYGSYTDDNDFLSKIYLIPEFLRSTGLTYTDVVTLLDTVFVNPGQGVLDYIEDLFSGSTLSSSAIYAQLKAIAGGADPSANADVMTALTAKGISAGDFASWVRDQFSLFQQIITSYQSTSACDLATTQLRTLQNVYESIPLSGISITDVWPKIHRFIRLWRKLGWKMNDLDALIAALGEKDITDTLAGKLSVVSRILSEWSIPPDKLATLWGGIATSGTGSLYSRLFLNRTVQEIDGAFKANVWGAYLTDTTALLKDHLPAVQAAFRVTGEDMNLIFSDVSLPLDTAVLNVANTSIIYRYTVLAKALKIPIADLINIKKLFGLDPFSKFDTVQHIFVDIDPQRTADFIRLATDIQASGFSVAALDYLLADVSNPQQRLDMPDTMVRSMLMTIRKGFSGIENDHPDSDLQNNITGDLLRSKLQLVYQPAIVDGLSAILDNTVVLSAVTDKNIPVTIPAPLNAKFSYIPGSGLLRSAGVVSDADKTSLDALAGVTPAFQSAVLSLYQQPEDFLKSNFATLFGAGMNAALAQLLDHPAQVSPPDLQARLNWLYARFLPFLKDQLRHNIVVQTLATVAGLDETTSQVLLQDKLGDLVGQLAPTGLTAVYYTDESFTTAGLTRTDAAVDFLWGGGAPDPAIPADHFSVRWTGYLNPRVNGDTTLVVQVTAATDAFRLYIDDQLVLEKHAADALLSWEDVVSLSMSQAYKLTLEYVQQTGDAGIRLNWKTDTTPLTLIDTASLFPAMMYDALNDTGKRFTKASILVSTLKLKADEVDHFIRNKANFSGIDFFALTRDHWRRMLDYTILRKSMPVGSRTLTELFSFAGNTNPAPASPDLLGLVVTVTGWNATTLAWLVSSHYNFGVADFRNEVALLTLSKAVQLVRKTGVAVDDLAGWSRPETDFDKLYDQAQSIKKAVKAKYEDDEWLDIAGKLSDKLRGNQSQALIQYLLVQPALIQWGVTDADGLYEYFLIDVQMCSCMDTSRIVQATAAVQLFVTRCILNLESRPDGAGHEQGVQPRQIDQSSATRWEWMQYYRVWEANRKVFLYPENWMDPELRDDKSPFFKELESELLQNDITNDSVADAFYAYLDKLHQVSHLDICGMYQENDTTGQMKTLHVFGRTHRKPYTYYYRTCDQYYHWSAWDKVPVDIKSVDGAANSTGDPLASGVHLTPVIWKDRLFLFWPEFMKRQPDTSGSNNSSFQDASKGKIQNLQGDAYWEASLAWTEYKNGKWAPKNISQEFIRPSAKIMVHDWSTYIVVMPESFEPDLKNYSIYPTIDSSDQLYLSLTHNRTSSHGRFVLNDIHNPVHIDFLVDNSYFQGLLDQIENGASAGNGSVYDSFFMQLANTATLKLKGNTYLQQTPDFRILFSPQFTNFESTLNYPFFYMDEARSYFVRSRTISWWLNIVGILKDGGSSKFVGIDVSKYAEAPRYVPQPHGDPAVLNLAGQVAVGVNGGNGAGVVNGVGGAGVVNGVGGVGVVNGVGRVAAPALLRIDGAAASIVSQSKQTVGYSKIGPAFAAQKDGSRYVDIPLMVDKGLTFYTNYHPYATAFARAMNTKGVDGLMDCDTTLPDDGGSKFETVYKPNHTNGWVQKPSDLASFTYYKENVAFDEFSLYGLYNWELFYHAPLYIATRLSKNGRYQEAMSWFHYIFDPTTNDVSPDPNFPESRYWKVLPFKTTLPQSLQDYFDGLKPGVPDPHIDEWKDNPFKPFIVARDRPIAFMKNVVMKYIDNLVAWGDDLFRTDTRENINTATQLYIIAAHILGPRPQYVPSRGRVRSETYNSLRPRLDAFSNAMVDLENLFPYTSDISVTDNPFPGNMLGVGSTLYFCIPDNDNLLQYWDTVGDRLFKIRHCMNIEGVERSLSLFAPPIDPGMLVRAAAAGLSIGSILADLNSPEPLYRFNYLLQRAMEYCAEVKALGSALLAAIEKKEAEDLQRIKAAHESRILGMVTAVKQRQILDAKASRQALLKSRETIVKKIQYQLDYLGVTGFTIPAGPEDLPGDLDQDYALPDTLITDLGLSVDVSLSDTDVTGVKIIPKEKEQLEQAGEALNKQLDSIQSEIMSGFFAMIPDFFSHGTPLGVGLAVDFGGKALAWMASSQAKSKQGESLTSTHGSTRAATMATFIRKEQEATHQANQGLRELASTDKQILAANIKIQIAERDLASHQQQIDNAQEVEDYLQNQLQGHTKFTTEEMYGWMKDRLFFLYKQSYQMAFDIARRAEKAYQFEMGNSNTNYIQYGYFDSTYQGLTAGEQLHFALLQLGKSYTEQNRREFELTKHISLALTRPDLLLQLKEKGTIDWSWPEELFDMDYPGHYFRRIKSVSLTIPCVTGPYSTVNATLRLLSNSIRINTAKGDNGYEHNSEGGVVTDDDRFVETKTPFVAIATSSGQNDSGVFELNFRDDRWLPFEGAGVIGKWRLELNGKFLQDDDTVVDISQFDFDAISDVVVTLRYTSREDAGLFRQDAIKHLQDYMRNVAENIQAPLMRLFTARQDLPSEWYRFLHPLATTDDQVFALDMSNIRFPFFTQRKTIRITGVELLGETAAPSINGLLLIAPDASSSTVDLVSGGKFGSLLHGSKDFTGAEQSPGAWVIRNPAANPRLTEDQLTNMMVIVHYELG